MPSSDQVRLTVFLRTKTSIQTVAGCDVLDQLQKAIEQSKTNRCFRKRFHTFKITGSPIDIVFRLDDIVTVSTEQLEA